jgi:hypothetical protein
MGTSTVRRVYVRNVSETNTDFVHLLLDYYSARVPRRITPNNLILEEQRTRGFGHYHSGRRVHNQQYSDELNKWMTRCLGMDPGRRPTVLRLVNDIGKETRSMLQEMSGKTALVDMELTFGVDA